MNNSNDNISISSLNIFQKMLRITSELEPIGKSSQVATGTKGSYKGVAEKDVIDVIKPLEEKYGVYSYPRERVVLESQMYEIETQYGDKPPQKKMSFMTRIMTTYRFVNVDNPEEFVETVTFAEGIDTNDKGSGKAMTYCDKYALLKAYKISTNADENDNGNVGDMPALMPQSSPYDVNNYPPPPPEPPQYRNYNNKRTASSRNNQPSQNGVGRWNG